MRNIFYLDNDFSKENSGQYILSIRFSTDGLSFSVHDSLDNLLIFSYKPFALSSQDEVIAKIKKSIVEDEFLNLKYKKVYVLPCRKEKILIPAHIFNRNELPDIYRVCIATEKNDTLIYKKIRPIEAYIAESLPRSFVQFLTARYQSLCIVNNAYPFIIHSLSSAIPEIEHLFIDIHDNYFDMLISKGNEVRFFNSFSYTAIPDMIYYILLCLKKNGITDTSKLHTSISGNLINDSSLSQILNQYIPDITLLRENALSDQLRNNDLNTSSFIYLLNMHRCE